MSAIAGGDETVGRAALIVGRSRIAALVDLGVRRSAASISQSRVRAFVQHCATKFQSLPPAGRVRCMLTALVAAIAGHVLLAAMLPASARPTPGLTALGLLGAGVVAAATVRRR